MKLLSIVAVLVIVVPAAGAANNPNPVFDAVATEVAGKPVSVWCESSWVEWVGVGLADANGVTILDRPIVFVSPRQCETLWALQTGESVGTYHAASALLTLAHESVHQRGITNEAQTDCLALPLVPQIATNHFRVPTTVSQSYTVMTSRRVRVTKTKWIVVKSSKVAVRQIPNPWLEQLAADALRWHQSKPADYQGVC